MANYGLRLMDMDNVSVLQRQGRTHSAEMRFQIGHVQGCVYTGQHSKHTTKQEIKKPEPGLLSQAQVNFILLLLMELLKKECL